MRRGRSPRVRRGWAGRPLAIPGRQPVSGNERPHLIGHALLRVECVEPDQVRFVPEGKLAAEARARPLERLGRIGARARLAEAAGHVGEQVGLGVGREGGGGRLGRGRGGSGGRARARARERGPEHREAEHGRDEDQTARGCDQRQPAGERLRRAPAPEPSRQPLRRARAARRCPSAGGDRVIRSGRAATCASAPRTVSVTSTSPARAWPQTRAAMLTAEPT